MNSSPAFRPVAPAPRDTCLRSPCSVAMPWPGAAPGRAVVPVFLPFFGCPRRCLFCAQEAQTGQRAPTGADLGGLLAAARDTLERRAAGGLAPAELAFYGGTFTALPREALDRCLAFAVRARRDGLIPSFRCSTRPDAVALPVLDRLARAGCATVELGVQSFSETALALARRGYDPARARRACALVTASGLELGVQLLPGMPGVKPADFLHDVDAALECGARALRFYPCLVLEHTGLAALWRAGLFAPWEQEETLETLARGWLRARRAGVAILRMGLAPGAELARALLAGPWHPALGARVLGRALLLAVRELLRGIAGSGAPEPAPHGRRMLLLEVPAPCQGHFWGHAGELRPRWAELGIGPESVRYVRAPRLRLVVSGEKAFPPDAQKRCGHRGGAGGR